MVDLKQINLVFQSIMVFHVYIYIYIYIIFIRVEPEFGLSGIFMLLKGPLRNTVAFSRSGTEPSDHFRTGRGLLPECW